MAKDKSHINLIVCDHQSQKYIFDFLQTLKRFNFIIKNINDCNFNSKENFLFIIDNENVYKEIQTTILKHHGINNNFLFLIQKDLNFHNNPNLNFIKVPEEINKIERQIQDFFHDDSCSYKNLYLKNSDVLVSKSNDKEILLTEIESKILRMLFSKNEIPKEKMSSLALGQKAEVESKSLESHLSRLRKKIHSIDNEVRIISDKGKVVKII